MNTIRVTSMKKMFVLGSLVLGACGPIARDVEEAKVANSPVNASVGVSSLETAFTGKGKMVLFKYDPSLDWMSDVCQKEKASGVFESVRGTWLAQVTAIAEQLGFDLGVSPGQAQIRKALNSYSPTDRESVELKEKALGMVDVVRTYDTLIKFDCKMAKGYRDRLAYMKTRLLSLGSEQDELYRDKQRIEINLIRSQKDLNEKLTQKLQAVEANFPREERLPIRLQAGLEGQRVKVSSAESNYQAKLPTLGQTLATEDGKLVAVLDPNGQALPVKYKCSNADDARMRDSMMAELEKSLGLKIVYRCADTDEYVNTYKTQSQPVKKVIKLSIDKIAKEFGPLFFAKEALVSYQENWDRWERGERDSMTIDFCDIEVADTYPQYAEEKAFCSERGSLMAMNTELPWNRLTLCTMVGETEEEKGYDPKGVMAKLSSEEQVAQFKQECIERRLRKDIAGRSIELGDDWLRQNASRPIDGKENLENYFIATDGSANLNFESYSETGKYIIEIYILQYLYIPETKTMGYVNMKYSTYDPGQISDVSFNGNSLKFSLNIRQRSEEQVTKEDGTTETVVTETFTGERINFDLDVAVIGGIRKLQGDAWFVNAEGAKVQGAAKATLDN